MKKILFQNNEYYVLDETPTHYITQPINSAEGYHFIDKSKAIIVK